MYPKQTLKQWRPWSSPSGAPSGFKGTSDRSCRVPVENRVPRCDRTIGCLLVFIEYRDIFISRSVNILKDNVSRKVPSWDRVPCLPSRQSRTLSKMRCFEGYDLTRLTLRCAYQRVPVTGHINNVQRSSHFLLRQTQTLLFFFIFSNANEIEYWLPTSVANRWSFESVSIPINTYISFSQIQRMLTKDFKCKFILFNITIIIESME